MKIIRFTDDTGTQQLGQDQGDGTAKLIEGDLFGKHSVTDEIKKVSQLLAPIEPTNIFCIGLNYREHAAESGAEIPKSPIVFMKPTSALAGPGQTILIPNSCDPKGEVDYECELAVVVGRPAREVSEDDALDYVLGYTAANDVSARKWQMQGGGGQWIRGKGFDTFCPIGPALVTADEIPDPQALAVSFEMDGKTLQSSSTAQMLFSVAELISILSREQTLRPGDVIATGTPAGVAPLQSPPTWIRPGAVMTARVEGLGALVNSVEESPA